LSLHKKAQTAPSAPLQNTVGTDSDKGGGSDDEDLTESQNIPLMRIVQSKKQTELQSSKVIKEGWMVHHTNLQDMKKKHYWRLNMKSIAMYHDDTSARCLKEIPLKEVLEVRCFKKEFLEQKLSYCLKIRTHRCFYKVGMWLSIVCAIF
uniref:Protein kinase C n=1 Tax=Syphacia muris TaxID=451379 RepID=A0A0N5A879_9BILA